MGDSVRLNQNAAYYGRLAEDHDRWGLAAEAETLRELHREAVVRDLKDAALERARGLTMRSGLRPRV